MATRTGRSTYLGSWSITVRGSAFGEDHVRYRFTCGTVASQICDLLDPGGLSIEVYGGAVVCGCSEGPG